MASGSRKLSAVELLEQFETYAYDGELELAWDLLKEAYKSSKNELDAFITTGTARELSQWRNKFQKQNELFVTRMGPVQYEKRHIKSVTGDNGHYAKLVDTPLNNLRFFVTRATQQCDTLVKALETLRRTQQSSTALTKSNAHLRLMRAYTDAF